MTTLPVRLATLVLCLTFPALAATACGGSSGGGGTKAPKVTHLQEGDSATVTGTEDKYKISMTVTADEGTPDDLKDFNLKASEKTMTPWYVKLVTKNVGKEIPKDVVVTNLVTPKDDHGLEPKNLLLLGSFDRCKLVNAPQPFPAGQEISSCEVYLVNKGSKLKKVVYHETRFEGRDKEIEWKVA